MDTGWAEGGGPKRCVPWTLVHNLVYTKPSQIYNNGKNVNRYNTDAACYLQKSRFCFQPK